MSEQPLWTGLSLVSALDAYVLGTIPRAATGVSIDTRTLQPGDLFFAIRGENSDGHAHVRDAFAKGACAAVVDEAHCGALRDAGPLYVVDGVLRALERLGAAARARTKARVIAVTGSVGKTSTKEALRLALGGQGGAHASIASYNNHWGVPLTLARMPQEVLFGVFEIGMNHAGEITPLAALVRPHVAVVTTIAPVHLENFASLDAIADAKAEIFLGLEPAGTAILHHDIPQYERLRERARAHGARVLSFGESEGAEARLLSVTHHESGTMVKASVLDRTMSFEIGAPGKHFALDALAVLLAAHAAGADVSEAAAALAGFVAPHGRGRRSVLSSPTGPFTIIDESYNANPASMRAALSLLGETRLAAPGRRIAVLGDMLELGPQAAELHVSLSETLIHNRVDLVYAAGPLMNHLFEALPLEMRGMWAARADQLIEPLVAAAAAGDLMMIKGSNGSRMGPIVAALEERCAARESAKLHKETRCSIG
ncbi:MAG TPA: UDP-N-acetylmuramoylalanyl-D-glutamyl-2,6-diaminopimelate--D-alanyl-D-alanine ligase [Beijerinckiaceae bacterium]|nr:UDP-N-acetylmuramoylalanyl-D-glutamyl-2,6-diaminopimelate--D-alanyl-D-alanine ligase [Beijerinckiaceae bacterium]